MHGSSRVLLLPGTRHKGTNGGTSSSSRSGRRLILLLLEHFVLLAQLLLLLLPVALSPATAVASICPGAGAQAASEGLVPPGRGGPRGWGHPRSLMKKKPLCHFQLTPLPLQVPCYLCKLEPALLLGVICRLKARQLQRERLDVCPRRPAAVQRIEPVAAPL